MKKQNGHLGIVKLLLERGTDVHAMNGSNIICKQEIETAELLWEKSSQNLQKNYVGIIDSDGVWVRLLI